MFNYFDIFISLFAVIGFCIFLNKVLNINSAFAPLFVISFSILFFTVFGCLNLLYLGGILYFILAAAAAAFTFAKYDKKDIWQGLKTPGFMLFTLASLSVIFLFAVRQPMFGEWDEFSFWGIASKVVKVNNQLYTMASSSMVGTSQTPALILLGYIFQFFGKAFAEWKVLAAYDILIFSIISALIGSFSFKKWKICVFLGLAGFLTPFFFGVFGKTISNVSIYMSALADIPMGMMLAGVLICYIAYSESESRQSSHLAFVAICLSALSLFKDMGFALSFIAASFIAADLLLIGKKDVAFIKIKGIIAKLIWIAVFYFSAAVSFLSWNKHLTYVAALKGTSGEMTTSITPVQMLIKGIGQIFAKDKDPYFVKIMSSMFEAFYTKNEYFKVSMIGGGAAVVMLIAAILIFAAFITKDKHHAKRTALFGILSIPAFLCYYTFLGFTYVYIFKTAQAEILDSYVRYVTPFYIMWLLCALLLLAQSCKNSRLYLGADLAVAAVSVFMLVKFTAFVLPQFSVVSYSDSINASRRQVRENAQKITQVLDKNDNVFFVSQNDNGIKWFYYSYELYPYILDYSFGGGQLVENESTADNSAYHVLSKEQLSEYLTKNNCRYMLIENIDEEFIDAYGSMFNDMPQNADLKAPLIYRVQFENGSAKLDLIG